LLFSNNLTRGFGLFTRASFLIGRSLKQGD
jgi:hypothetical protein